MNSPTPTGFLEIVSDDFPVFHFAMRRSLVRPRVNIRSRQRLRDSERSNGLLRDGPKRFRFLNAESFDTILAMQPFAPFFLEAARNRLQNAV
jgi:hypothetical protein